MNLQYMTSCYGVTRSGKTRLALKILDMQPGIKLFVDTKNETEYHKYFHNKNHHIPLDNFKPYLSHLAEMNDKMIILSVDIEKDIDKQLNDFLLLVFLHQRKDNFFRINILIDELPFYKIDKKALGVWLQGLSKNIRILYTAQGWSLVPKKIRNSSEITILLKQRDNDISDLMDQGFIQYEWSESGNKRIPLVKFEDPYEAWMEWGIKGELRRLQ